MAPNKDTSTVDDPFAASPLVSAISTCRRRSHGAAFVLVSTRGSHIDIFPLTKHPRRQCATPQKTIPRFFSAPLGLKSNLPAGTHCLWLLKVNSCSSLFHNHAKAVPPIRPEETFLASCLQVRLLCCKDMEGAGGDNRESPEYCRNRAGDDESL